MTRSSTTNRREKSVRKADKIGSSSTVDLNRLTGGCTGSPNRRCPTTNLRTTGSTPPTSKGGVPSCQSGTVSSPDSPGLRDCASSHSPPAVAYSPPRRVSVRGSGAARFACDRHRGDIRSCSRSGSSTISQPAWNWTYGTTTISSKTSPTATSSVETASRQSARARPGCVTQAMPRRPDRLGCSFDFGDELPRKR